MTRNTDLNQENRSLPVRAPNFRLAIDALAKQRVTTRLLAIGLNISPSLVSQIYHGDSKLSLNVARSLADAYPTWVDRAALYKDIRVFNGLSDEEAQELGVVLAKLDSEK